MADYAAIADGLQARLATISGLRAYSEWPDQLNVPAGIVLPGEPFLEDATFDGNYDATYDLLLLVNKASGDVRGTRALYAYMASTGTLSVRAALDGDTTLGGAAHDLIHMQVFGYGEYTHGTVPYLGYKHRVRVLA